MRWQLAGDWPVGPTLIPAGTVLDGATPGIPLPMPINAIALDEEAALQMCMHHRRVAPAAFRPRHRSRGGHGESGGGQALAPRPPSSKAVGLTPR